MKLTVKLVLALLAISLSLPGTALSREDVGYWASPIPSGSYLDRAGFGSAYTPYGGKSLDFDGGGNSRPRSRDPGRIGDSSSADVYATSVAGPSWARILGAGHLSYPPPDEGVDHRWGAAAQTDMPDYRSHDYSGQGNYPEALPHWGTNADRFRVFESADFDARISPLWRYGYRFRPLTDQERQRMYQGDGWRPRIPNPIWERPHQTNSLLPNDAYGYQTDSWVYR